MSKKGRTIRASLLVLLACITIYVWAYPQVSIPEVSNELLVHFLDVGQGDAIFIETPDGVQVLIDGGRDNTVLMRLGEVIPFYDTSLDMIIATHPDTDHIGGLRDVLEQYTVATIVRTENETESATFDIFSERMEQEGAEVVIARRGMEFALGASTTLRVLFPETDTTGMESNTSSVVTQLIYGDTTFLLTGDAPKSIEEYLVLVEGEHLKSDVLKVGHHGSRTSTSLLFLDEVAPSYAVISASADNTYGHPHVEVTDALFNARVQTYSTAEEGTILFSSNGEVVTKH